MTGLLGSGTGRRAATTAAPRLLTTSRWRTAQQALTLLIAGGAAIVGIQLGLTGPLTSPVRPTAPVAGVPAAAGDGPQAQARNDGLDVVGRGSGNRGGRR